ncbi:MAG: type II toxin-antitoxin system VapC family toxin [Chloroflexi bacterium]|nr:type II toxin-antitoxin system VapC family toxin [Chloroflexota bacterium]
MIIDTSVIVAIFFQEPEFENLIEKLAAADNVGIGSPTLVECGIVLSARLNRDARSLLTRFLKETNMIVIPFTEAHYETAVSAWLKFGKGRHAAKLNFGDCMSYATAKLAGKPLLFIGDDFSQTDLTLA